RLRRATRRPPCERAQLEPRAQVALFGSDARDLRLTQLPLSEANGKRRNVPCAQAGPGDLEQSFLEGQQTSGCSEPATRHQSTMKRSVHLAVDLPACFVELRSEAVTSALGCLQPEP